MIYLFKYIFVYSQSKTEYIFNESLESNDRLGVMQM